MKSFYYIIIFAIMFLTPPLKAEPESVYYNNQHDSITSSKKYRNLSNYSDESAEKIGLLKITSLNHMIQPHKALIGIAPQNLLDYAYIEDSFGDFIKCNPYDTIVVIKEDFYQNIYRQQESFRKSPDFEAKFEKKLKASLAAGTIEKMSRRDMWERELRIYKKYMPAKLFPDVKKAVCELHDSLGLSSWNDTIYVLKGRVPALVKFIKKEVLKQDSIMRNKLQTEFFEQYSNDTRNKLTWEEQLEYAINVGKQQKGVKSPIKLKGYKERGYIKNDKEKSKLIEKMFSKKSCIALKNGKGKTHYGIYNIEHILATLPEGERSTDQFAYIKKRLAEIIEPSMKLLQLEWEYDKQTFYTTAIISSTTNKIIYDNVGTIAASDIKEFNEWDTAPQLHIGTTMEYENTPAEIRVVQPKPFAKSFIEYNMLGQVKYSYAVHCRAHFDEDGILTDYKIVQRSYSDDFHDCKTDVRTIEGDKGTSPRYKFFYIMGCGRMPLSIEWNEEGGARISVTEYYDKGERTLKPRWW